MKRVHKGKKASVQWSATGSVGGAAIYGGCLFAWKQQREPSPFYPPLPPFLPNPHLPFLLWEIRVLVRRIPEQFAVMV